MQGKTDPNQIWGELTYYTSVGPRNCTAVFCQMRGDDRLREVMTGTAEVKTSSKLPGEAIPDLHAKQGLEHFE